MPEEYKLKAMIVYHRTKKMRHKKNYYYYDRDAIVVVISRVYVEIFHAE